ncbi:MAG: hypothetical protein KatS3mg032_1065 [Cyclobacteriaceae bacterium]|nr:MAG: hypothetical protein KatS3mg032_1065 [Cyclobacteriaceae bacterium]
MRLTVGFFILLLFYLPGIAQNKSYTGYIADSVTLAPLAGVHVALKNRLAGTVSSGKGFFSITALPTDTLIFSLTGYELYELPLIFEEDALFIRLREKITYLDEIKITASRLLETARPARPLPKPLPESSAFANPIEYFSRWQREKRKLLRLSDENNKTFLYNQIVNDPFIRKDLLQEFNLSETTYYNLLVKFNQQEPEVQYFSDSDKIISALRRFLQQQTR